MKPKVSTKCIANHYAAPNERIIEYSANHGNLGGLISFTVSEDGKLTVCLYRHDPQVKIVVSKPS